MSRDSAGFAAAVRALDDDGEGAVVDSRRGAFGRVRPGLLGEACST